MKIAVGIGAIGAIVCICVAVGIAQAASRRGGSGAPHPAAHAAPHFAAPHIARAAPHFAVHRAAPHFAVRRAAPHVAVRRAAPHVAARHAVPHVGATRFAAHNRGAGVYASSLVATHGAAVANAHGALAHAANHNTVPTDPHNFAARRHFADNAALRPFVGRGHGHGHGYGGSYGYAGYGWVGPVFWPYAFGDFFYDALWPYEYGYYDPFWADGYDDIYAGIFSPYDYEPYVQGPLAPARMTALVQGMKQACDNEAAEVTNWPIGQIQEAIAPNAAQKALLDDLGNAVVKASNEITEHCPASVAFTPVDRLAQMEVRLQGLIDAVNTIEPPLTTFYDSLNDEQKARFNDMGAPQGATAANGPANHQPTPQQAKVVNPQQACNGEKIMSWPTDKIEQKIAPTDAQKQKLDALQAAAGEAADIIKDSCPSELPATPADRLAAIGKRLQAQLKAVQTVQAPLKDFYDSLSDEQKAGFNNMGEQIFAQR